MYYRIKDCDQVPMKDQIQCSRENIETCQGWVNRLYLTLACLVIVAAMWLLNIIDGDTARIAMIPIILVTIMSFICYHWERK